MLGTDKSRGYSLEMICADFLAGAHWTMATRANSCPTNGGRLSLESLREKVS